MTKRTLNKVEEGHRPTDESDIFFDDMALLNCLSGESYTYITSKNLSTHIFRNDPDCLVL